MAPGRIRVPLLPVAIVTGIWISHRPDSPMKPKETARPRRAAVALELALVLPVLCLMALGGLDFARILFAYTTITNCAFNGALYASDATAAAKSPYTSYALAAVADGSSLTNPALSTSDVALASGSDTYGSYVEVTVTYRVPMLTGLFASSTATLARKVRMRVAPALPG